MFPQLTEEKIVAEFNIPEIAIVGMPAECGVNKLIAYVHCEEVWEETKGKLIEFSKANLDVWDCPDDYVRMDNLPRTQIGKINYRELEKL